MGLKKYNEKRNFAVTSEPSGARTKRAKVSNRFVIQKHDASRLHYDFRLEMDGVLKSWAVPKGLPWAKGEKHLAVEVEDHPIDYEDFEGVIPEGNYGGGTVMVWDRGKYAVEGDEPMKALRAGKIRMRLEGEKAEGEWTLVRLRVGDSKPQWLLIKSGESIRPVSKKREDQSAKSGHTMAQIAKSRDAEWRSNREDKKKPVAKSATQTAAKKKSSPSKSKLTVSVTETLPAAKPRFISPMKPKLSEHPPADGNWFYELKFDGIRLLAIKDGEDLQLLSRNENELGSRFPELCEAIHALPTRDFVIDGEVVALDDQGRSSFQLLQAREIDGHAAPIYYYVFDLLQADGKLLTGLPLEMRKDLLGQLCQNVRNPIRISGEISGEPGALLAEVKRLGLEGIIGKRKNSQYEEGRRSGAWIKLKCLNEQEFVIGGYTPPQGARKYFGALLVGYHENERFLFAGKVGTGFDTKLLRLLYDRFQKLTREKCPFENLPSKQTGQWLQGITPAEMRRCIWLEPELVCQLKFSEWTRDGSLRQPVFLGLREDKEANEVRREDSHSA